METRYWLDKDDLQWILKRDYLAKVKARTANLPAIDAAMHEIRAIRCD